MKLSSEKSGFTIIELIVVITVISLLATISYFILSGWRVETARTEVKHDLQNVVSEIDTYRNFNNAYPGSFGAIDYTPTDSVDIQYYLRSDGNSYCINGSSKVESDVEYQVDTRTNQHVTEGSCTAS